MSQLIVNQKHVDGMAKRFADLLATITADVNNVANTLNTGNEPNVEARETLTPFVNAAEKLSHAVNLLATLTVTKRWQLAMQKATEAEDPAHRTMAAVAHSLRNALVMNSHGLSDALQELGPFAYAFRSSVVEQLADAVGMCDVLQASHETTENLCAANGIDYAAVNSGDKVAIGQLVDVVERTNGGPVPGLRERLGLDPLPEPVRPDFSPSTPGDAAIAEALGLDSPPVFTQDLGDGAAIRA